MDDPKGTDPTPTPTPGTPSPQRKGSAKAPARCSNHPACSSHKLVATIVLTSGDTVRYCRLCFEEWVMEELDNMEQGDRLSLLCEREKDGPVAAIYRVGN